MATDFANKVYEVVKAIPCGSVLTYKQVAQLCGKPKAARAVGNALHHNPCPKDIPCHRVVNSKGELAISFAFGGIEEQKQRLEAEGVKIVNNKIKSNL